MPYTTIKKPSDYFNTVTYTGDGSASRNITGVGFQPDFVWGKCRNVAVSHALYDAVRGASNLLNSNSTSAEGTNAALNAFISDGFTVNSDSYLNGNTNTYVSWNWLGANGTASNTVGDITSTVSVNTTSGFSIVSYTGTGANATVGHGLGSVPKMIIIKELNNATNWIVYHSSVGNGGGLQLNTSIATDVDSTFWNSTTPTSSVFSLGVNGNCNGSGDTYIAYCFAEKQGYSKFGSYTGNGNADGTFVYTGFKPAFLVVKRTDSSTGGSWIIFDTKRNPYNVSDIILASNDAGSESDWGTNYDLDILSNGFKLRYDGVTGISNASGASYIYMAFAEEPLVGDNPATAR